MAQVSEVYECEICGNLVEVLRGGAGELVCCDQPMVLLTENTVDAAREKHVPVIEKTEAGYKVTVGSVPHPMEQAHFIEWIELIADGKTCRRHLSPGDPPEATFCLQADSVKAREHCNLHSLWSAQA